MKLKIFFQVLLFVFLSCSRSYYPYKPDNSAPDNQGGFNFSFRYGIGAKNEIDTFHNTLTKDLVLDGTVTVPFSLSKVDLDQIKRKMIEIGFFSYPDTFIVTTPDSIVMLITPYCTYQFNVQDDFIFKTLYWNDSIIASDVQAERLRELIALIRSVVESKPKYQQLPPVKGGYI